MAVGRVGEDDELAAKLLALALHHFQAFVHIFDVELAAKVVQVVAQEDGDLKALGDLVLARLLVARVAQHGQVLLVGIGKASHLQVVHRVFVGALALLAAGHVEHLDVVVFAKLQKLARAR